MPDSSVAPDELKRLAVLRSYGLLDSVNEEPFDRIARLAARLFDVPTVLITLVDENRQWFKSRIGFDVCETARDVSFCSHVVNSQQMMVVPDTHRDARFADNALVTGAPHVRFYAGAPLRVPQGVTLGTLCLIDSEPREFSGEDRAQLADLAAIVVDKMKLRYNERLYRSLVEGGSELVTIFDVEGEVVYQSPVITRLLGYDADELSGDGLFDIIHPDDQALVSRNHAHMRATKTDIAHYSFRARHKSGEWRMMECYTRYQVEHPQIAGVVSIVRDVTERSKIERQLNLSEERFKAIFEQSSVGTAIVARDSSLVRINNKFAEMTGIARGDCGATLYSSLMHPDELTEALVNRDQLLSGELQCLVWERHLLCRGGEYRWSLFNISLIRDDEGAPDYYIVQVQDIHERKKQEERLRLLESVAVNSNDAVLITEAEPTQKESGGPRILYANEAYFRMSGYTRDEVIGKTPRIMQGPGTDAETRAMIRKSLEKWKPVVAEILNYTKDGTPFWVELSIVPVADETGWFTHWVSTQRDITERKQSEAALIRAREEAEAANRAKSEFLSRMSHELRTPLNAILGFGQLLELEEQNPANRESTDQILKAGRHLLELINEVLDISRIETGRMAMSLEPVSAAEVARETLDLVRSMAAQYGVSLREDGVFDSPLMLRGDRRRVKQVLLNLLSNAIKYNSKGGQVRLSIERLASAEIGAEELGRARLCVADSGAGIAPAMRERLWVPFDRLDAETTDIEGTGIGLALSYRLAQAMEGELDFKSGAEGSTFWLELPCTLPLGDKSSDENAIEKLTPVSTRWVALYIEDNLPNVQLVQGILARRPEVRLLTAFQGALGVELATQHCPDIILLDLHLPDINGDEVLRRLRANPATSHVPVVMISADATPGQVERLLKAGADEYLSKPFDIAHFLSVLDGCIAKGQERA